MKRDFSGPEEGAPALVRPAKSELRQLMLQKLRTLDPEMRLKFSQLICQSTAQWLGFQQAHTVALFASLRTEPDTRLIREEAWAQKKRVVLPRTWPEGRLTWHQVRDESEIHNWEPGKNCPLVPLEELECVLVPGLAFDDRGYRLGRGGGFYDRFLARLSDTVPCRGLMFSAQHVQEVPSEPHDVPLPGVITETGLVIPT